jgi:RNA polymerase sigma-70 factor (ECF subfamily)
VLFIQQYVGDFHVAEDISQDVFVKLYVKKPHYSPKASFKTWLYTIAKRESMNYLKRQKNQADVDLAVLSAN